MSALIAMTKAVDSTQASYSIVARQGVLRRVLIAHTFLQRFIGLLNRRSIEADEGLLIVPGGSVHTAWMRFSIDIVFLNAAGEVLRVASQVPPWRCVFAPRHTRAVLELRAGVAILLGIQANERITLLNAT